MDLPDVIAAAWSLCVRHWQAFMLTALAPVAVWTALSAGLYRAIPTGTEEQPLTAEQTRDALTSGLPWIAALMVAGMAAHLALLRQALDLIGGERARPWRTLAQALGALPRVLLIWLGTTLLVIAGFTVMAALAFSPLGWAALLALLITRWGRRVLVAAMLWLRAGWYAVVGLLLVAQVAVHQRTGLRVTVLRAGGLVRGHAWRTLAVGLSVFVVSLLPGFVLARAGAAFGSDVWAVLLGGAAMLLQAPFLAAGHTLLYLDLRVRHGGSPLAAASTEREAL